MCPLLVVDNQSTVVIVIILICVVNKNNYHLHEIRQKTDLSSTLLLK